MAIQKSDNQTLELPDLPKRRGRPSTGFAKSNATRQALHQAKKRVEVTDAIGNESTASSSALLLLLAHSVKSVDKSRDLESPAAHSLRRVLAELNNRYNNEKH